MISLALICFARLAENWHHYPHYLEGNWHHYPYFTDEEEEAKLLKGCRSELNRSSLNLIQELTLNR